MTVQFAKFVISCVLIFSHSFCLSQTWQKVEVDSDFDQNFFTKIHFINDDVGIVVGNNGMMYRTIDAGNNWSRVETGVSTHFNDISFVDENIGYVNGLKTTNGGSTWMIQESTASFKFLHAIDENHLIANTENGPNAYYQSIDGGDTWETISLPPLPEMDLYNYMPNDYSHIDDDIAYMSLSKGVLMGSDSLGILKTNNGGGTWERITVLAPTPPPTFGFQGFREIDFISEDHGLLVHGEGLLKTTDSGESFTEIIPEQRPEFWGPVSIFATDSDHYLLVGLKPFVSEATVTMYETIDGGLNWEEAIVSTEYLNDATCTSDNCFAVGRALYKKFETSNTQNFVSEDLVLSPNPTTDYLHLAAQNLQTSSIKIYDLEGKIYRHNFIDLATIDVSELPNGIYFLKLADNEGVKTLKFIKS